MTKTEELAYLYDIMSEAREWTITDPKHNAVELEVDLRIKNIIKELSLHKTVPAPQTTSESGRTRPSELRLVPGLSLAQYKYRARAQLAGLSDAEIEQKYAFYRECYDGVPQLKTEDNVVDNAAEKMRQEEQMWAEHYKSAHAAM